MYNPRRLEGFPLPIGGGEPKINRTEELNFQNGGLDLDELEKIGALLSKTQREKLRIEQETLGSEIRLLESKLATEGGYAQFNKLSDRLLRVDKILGSKIDIKSHNSQNYH